MKPTRERARIEVAEAIDVLSRVTNLPYQQCIVVLHDLAADGYLLQRYDVARLPSMPRALAESYWLGIGTGFSTTVLAAVTAWDLQDGATVAAGVAGTGLVLQLAWLGLQAWRDWRRR